MIDLVKKSTKITACLVSFLLGASGVLAYSPFDFWAMAYVSAAGLLGCVMISPRRTALWAVFCWSIGYFSVGVNWIHVSMIQFGGVPEIVSYLAVLLLAAYLALYNLLFIYLAKRFSLTSPLALASLFTFTEYLRGVMFTGFPWLQFGYSQIDSPFFAIAQIFGVEGLTFFVITVTACLLQIGRVLIKQKRIDWLQLGSIAFVVAFAFGAKSLTHLQKDPQKAPLVVSLVQGNIAQQIKWDPDYFAQTVQTYYRLVAPLLGKSDVIILPESAIPALESDIQPIMQSFDAAGSEKNSEIIIGTLYQDANQEMFNSALVLGNKQSAYQMFESTRYKKHHLVPFGEYVPFGSLLDWMREVFILPINLSQGEYVQPAMLAKNYRFNMAICYEIIFGDQVQKNQLSQQSDYLLTITNDAWFGASIGPWQHFQMARMRALELGKPLLRAANTGITAWVDEQGKVVSQLPQFEEGVLTESVSAVMGETLFSRYGNMPLYLIGLFLLALALVKQRSSKGSQ